MRFTRRGKVVIALSTVVLLLGIPVLAGYIYLNSIGVLGASDPGPRVEVEIPEGSDISAIGEILADAGVIKAALGLRIRAYLDGGGDAIQAGTYRLRENLNAQDALLALLKGPESDFVTVTFPEGSWVEDFARIAQRDTHLRAADVKRVATNGSIRASIQPRNVDTLEGLMFPSTYQVVESETAETFVERLVDEFESQIAELDPSGLDELGVTPYEAVIVASMVEAEARVPEDRGKIARVIYNRLDAGNKLEIDATVLYALGEHRAVLTSSDLAIDSPYNTRLYTGLPPTPIGAPGAASLEAAFNPPPGDWFFFVVSDCEGHHAFSVTYEQFLADKAEYQALDC